MSQKYKLTYSKNMGRAEVTRLIFAQAGVQYEDIRHEREDLPKYKDNSPTGQFPIIEIDGQVYCQSNAISRYLAKQFGLSGKTTLEELRADMIVDTLNDMFNQLLSAFLEEDEEKKAVMKKKFEEEQYPTILQNLEKMLVANNGGDGYFVGDGLTWADLSFLHWFKAPTREVIGVKLDVSKVPKLEALYQRLQKEPRISEWLEKRPQTMF